MAKKDPEISAKQAEEMREYLSVEYWLQDLNPTGHRHLLRSMVRFTRFTGKNPDEILEWARKADSHEIQDMINQASKTVTSPIALKSDMRSFLRHNGVNNLPKTRLKYVPKQFHRGYKREEIKKLIGFLRNRYHKLYAYMVVETGLRAQMVLDIQYKHIKEDWEAQPRPDCIAVKFPTDYYSRSKAAGFCFLGPHSIELLKEIIERDRLKLKPEDHIIAIQYQGIYAALNRAKAAAGLPRELQPIHGFRKWFDRAVTDTDIPHEYKDLLKGRFTETVAKHYTDRGWEDVLRPMYRKVLPLLDPDVTPNPELDKELRDWKDEKSQLLKKFEQEKEDMARKVLKFMDENKKVLEASQRLGPYLEMMEKANLSPEELKEFFTLARDKARKGKGKT